MYDPLGFAAPVKVYGSYICRRALIESAGDPLKEVGEETRKLFLQYTFQVKMLDNVMFARNRSMRKRHMAIRATPGIDDTISKEKNTDH